MTLFWAQQTKQGKMRAGFNAFCRLKLASDTDGKDSDCSEKGTPADSRLDTLFLLAERILEAGTAN
jgi:hypothetical protein